MIFFNLTNSIIFQRCRYTSNQSSCSTAKSGELMLWIGFSSKLRRKTRRAKNAAPRRVHMAAPDCLALQEVIHEALEVGPLCQWQFFWGKRWETVDQSSTLRISYFKQTINNRWCSLVKMANFEAWAVVAKEHLIVCRWISLCQIKLPPATTNQIQSVLVDSQFSNHEST
jgi:hypothetical protein